MAPEITPFSVTSTVRRDSPVPHWEYHVGNFITRKTAHVTEIGFSDDIARQIAELALVLAKHDVQSVFLLFYPWLEEAWKEHRKNDWTTVETRVFAKRGWFGRRKERSWTMGFAHVRTKLVGMIEWLWTLPGRDTFIILPSAGPGAVGALEMMEDDREDDGSNEERMIAFYQNVLSRGERGAYLRVLSTSCSEEEMVRAVAAAAACPP